MVTPELYTDATDGLQIISSIYNMPNQMKKSAVENSSESQLTRTDFSNLCGRTVS